MPTIDSFTPYRGRHSTAEIDNTIERSTRSELYIDSLQRTKSEKKYNVVESVGTHYDGMVNASTGEHIYTGEHLEVIVTHGEVYLVSGFSWNANEQFPLYFIIDENGVVIEKFGSSSTSYSDRIVMIPSGGYKMYVNGGYESISPVVKSTSSYDFPNFIDEYFEKVRNMIYARSITPYVENSSVTLSDVYDDGYYIIPTTYAVTDAPSDVTPTALVVENLSTARNKFIRQTLFNAVSFGNSKIYQRVSNSGNVFSAWVEIYTSGYGKVFTATQTPLDSTDLNNLYGNNCMYLLKDNGTYTNKPPVSSNSGFLFCYSADQWTLQEWTTLSGEFTYRRRGSSATSWSQWVNVNPKSSDLYAKSITQYATGTTLTLSSVLDNGYFIVPTNYTVSDAPVGLRVTGLIVENLSTTGDKFVRQTVFDAASFGTSKMFQRVSNANNVFSDWVEVYTSAVSRSLQSERTPLASIDLNELYNKNSVFLLVDNNTYTNKPSVDTNSGFLFCYTVGIWTLQEWMTFRGDKVYRRRGSAVNSWSDWVLSSGGESVTIENIYNIPHYANVCNVTASPTITSDTNNYLASTGDTTDRTADIMTMLTQNKTCHLGSGIFYVSGVDMPDDTMLCGNGTATSVVLSGSGSDDGYAIKLGSRCVVKDMAITGSLSSITLSDSVGGRHGILFEGNANASGDSNPQRSTVSKCYITNFNGGAITCYNTGYSPMCSINASDCFLFGNCVGINIAYWSEFNRFTNISSGDNYYGCINNGGNNMFLNCNFSKNKLGFLIDNANSQSTNNAHGSAIGCVFNHTDNNSGIGIKILNTNNGFAFVGCQIFFSQIYLEDVKGFSFTSGVFGASNCDITIKNGSLTLFSDNQHQDVPTITIQNNQNVHFTNCYVRQTGAVVSN